MRRGCSIPARCFRPCTAAPNWGACMCMPASWRFRIFRGFEGDEEAVIPGREQRERARNPFLRRVCGAMDSGSAPFGASRNDNNERMRTVTTLKPRNAKDVEDAVRSAIASEQPLETIGHGSKRAIGHPTPTNALLELSALNAVKSYEPNELIITVEAGAPLADVKSLIDSKSQRFAFEPMNTAPLLGTPERGTIGGMLGAGLAGPRRIQAGGARDHLLGAQAISGFGDTFKAGGKVVKNVTGYDLCKLLAGSWGTLAVVTEVTLKVMPRPESERTLLLRGLDDVTANQAMTAALGSPFDVSGAAHVPKSALRDAAGALSSLGSPRDALTLVRLEGITASVTHRAASLAKLLARFGTAETIEDDRSAAVWERVRDVEPFAAKGPLGAWPVWRIVCPPASGGALR